MEKDWRRGIGVMKKVWFIIVTVVVLVAVGGIIVFSMNPSVEEAKEEENVSKDVEKTENQFDAKVAEVQKEYIMVEALDGQTIAGEVQVWIGLLSDDEIPELKVGDTVRITHDGKMTMSLPPQMSAVEPIVILK